MDETRNTEWIEPYKGYLFQQRDMTVESADQARLLDLCGIDPNLFAGCMDPAGFISLAIQEGVRNRIHANGTVNMVNQLIQHKKVKLGEVLTVTGEVLDVEEVPRGRVATSKVCFRNAAGAPAYTSLRKSLRPDPAKAGVRGAGERPAAVIEDIAKLVQIARFTLIAERVREYGGPHNPIHTDPEAARKAGFRAPIIGGGQGVRFITAEIWKRFAPQVIDAEFYFRRPIYWDDTFDVMVDEVDGRWRAVCLAKEGKIAYEARINRID
jgi:acyl dehydratase